MVEAVPNLPTQYSGYKFKKHSTNPEEALEWSDNIDMPRTIKQDELIIRVKRTDVNPIDISLRNGSMRLMTSFTSDFVLGKDAVGEVVMRGDQVTKFKLGDTVMGFTGEFTRTYGTNAQYALFKEHELCLKPDALDERFAAALPLAITTAYDMFHQHPDVRNVKSVLIHGGSGSVGNMCILLAKHYFNIPQVYTTCHGTDHVRYCQSLGADFVIDYKTQDFEIEVKRDMSSRRDISSTGKIDMILDAVCSSENLRKGYHLLHGDSVYVCIVPPTFADTTTEAFKRAGLMAWDKLLGAITHNPKLNFVIAKSDGDKLQRLVGWFTENKFSEKLRIAEEMPLKDLPRAHRLLETGHVSGKIIIDVD